MASGLYAFSRQIAEGWAAARGQQDRINNARYVQTDIEDDSLLEDVGEFFGGETDYGRPAQNPATRRRPPTRRRATRCTPSSAPDPVTRLKMLQRDGALKRV
jgi:hypothetical protein